MDDKDSFNAIESRWIKYIVDKDRDYKKKPVILLGSKYDIEGGDRKVSNEEGKALADKLKPNFSSLEFFEISAQNGGQLERALSSLFEKLKEEQNEDEEEEDKSEEEFEKESEKESKKESCCRCC